MTDFTGLSNEELVVMYQQTGDMEIFNVLWEKNQGILTDRTLAFLNSVDGYDVEDLVQTAYEPFIKAMDLFDINKGAKFSTVVHTYVNQHFMRLAHKSNAQCRRGDTVSYEALVEIHKEGGDEVHPNFISQNSDYDTVDFMDLLNSMNLSPTERTVVKGIIAQDKKGDIAKHLGITGAGLTYHIRKIEEKLSPIYA